MTPEAILRDLLALDPGLRRERYYGEDAVFYNPGRVAPLGVILAAVKDHDGPRDRAARLSRAGVWRFAFGLSRETFAQRLGSVPKRPPKGGVVDLAGWDLTALDVLTPHPVYAWMSWVQILCPSPERLVSLRPLLDESLGLVKAKWSRHHVRGADAV